MDINNNVEENICSFDLSIILSDIGFDCITNQAYNRYTKEYFTTDWPNIRQIKYDDIVVPCRFNSEKPWLVSAPTHGQALDWIRLNSGYNISVNPDPFGWTFTIDRSPPPYPEMFGDVQYISDRTYNTPSIAFEEGMRKLLGPKNEEN